VGRHRLDRRDSAHCDRVDVRRSRDGPLSP